MLHRSTLTLHSHTHTLRAGCHLKLGVGKAQGTFARMDPAAVLDRVRGALWGETSELTGLTSNSCRSLHTIVVQRQQYAVELLLQ